MIQGISRTLCLAGVFLGLIATGAVIAPSALARSCPGTFQGGFFTDLTTQRASCATGRHVLHTWVRRSGFGHGAISKHVHFGAWTCRLVTVTHGENPAGRITCRASGGRLVRFFGAP